MQNAAFSFAAADRYFKNDFRDLQVCGQLEASSSLVEDREGQRDGQVQDEAPHKRRL